MRALYMLKPSEISFQHVDEAFKSKAIDSVLLAVYASSPDANRPWLDSYGQSVEDIKKIGQYGPVYPVILWQDQNFPNSHILNEPQARIRDGLRLVHDTGVGAVLFDVEDYRAGAGQGKQNQVPSKFGQWCSEAGLPVLGAMPQNQGIGGAYFDERTYDGEDGWWNCFRYKAKKFFGGPTKLPGVWVERFNDPIPYIAEMNDCRGGYWIYSHVRFGQRVDSDHKKWYVSDGPLPLSFWQKLKRATS